MGLIKYVAIVSSGILLLQGSAMAFGKKPAAAPSPTTPIPLRVVSQLDIQGVKAFDLPNGVSQDPAPDLKNMLGSSVTSSVNFSAAMPVPPDHYRPCERHLELQSAITYLQLKAATIGVTFGWAPSGSLPVSITDLKGDVDVNIGQAEMTFTVNDCMNSANGDGQDCHSVISTAVNQKVLSGDVSFKVDFAQFTAGVSFISYPALAARIQKIMDAGMRNLAADPRINELFWQAQVSDVIPGSGLISIDVGGNDHLATNQAFEIYAPAQGDVACPTDRYIAKVHTTDVGSLSSYAEEDASFDSSTPVQVGDKVTVHVVPAAK